MSIITFAYVPFIIENIIQIIISNKAGLKVRDISRFLITDYNFQKGNSICLSVIKVDIKLKDAFDKILQRIKHPAFEIAKSMGNNIF